MSEHPFLAAAGQILLSAHSDRVQRCALRRSRGSNRANFPFARWRKIRSTNPLERLNARSSDARTSSGRFPNDAVALRLITAVVVETHDERAAAERRYLSEESMALLHQPPTADDDEAPLAITA